MVEIDDEYQEDLTPLKRAFVLALVVCYHACLQDQETRKKYRELIEKLVEISDQYFDDYNEDWVMIEKS